MGITELNRAISTFYGNPKLFTPPCPFHLQIADKTFSIEQSKEETIYHIIKYVLDPQKTSIYSGNVFMPHFSSLTEDTYTCITDQFMKVKEHYDKLSPYPILHIIITFAPDYYISASNSSSIMELFISYLNLSNVFNSHQYIYAIHNTQWNAKENRLSPPHIHLVMSTTNYRTGETFDLNKTAIKEWKSALLFSMEPIITPILYENNSNIEKIAKKYQIKF